MTDYESIFPSKYFKAADLDGQPKLVIISRWATEEVGKQRDHKPVLYFQGEDKALVCNVTNARTIAKILDTRDIDAWIGKEIVLYPTTTEFAGEMMDCIRVARKGAKPPQPKTAKDDSIDEIPF